MKTFVALTFGDNTVASVISYGFSIVKLAAMFETGGVLQARSDMQTYSLLSYFERELSPSARSNLKFFRFVSDYGIAFVSSYCPTGQQIVCFYTR